MPKRIGYLYEQVISVQNCIEAEKDMTKHKSRNRKALAIRSEAERYGKELSELLSQGKWEPAPYKEHIIYDGYRHKERRIKVPTLLDQAVHHAVMRVTAPYILNRNYFYNCGSIPGAGQRRAVNAMKSWLGGKKKYKYGETLDIRKFYDTCPHATVMKALRRVFKDEKFLKLHEKILASMSENGVGLAIGYYPSQWYANLVLTEIDNKIKECYPDIKLARYMDDFALIGNNKRKLRYARDLVIQMLTALGMKLKQNWQVFRIKDAGFPFLSYRFFYGFTLLKKCLMYRISKRMRNAGRNINAHVAAGVVSYMGILKHCNSFNYRKIEFTRTYQSRNARRL